MDKILGFDMEKLKSLGGFDTAVEINQQPVTWLKAYDLILQRSTEIEEFMDRVLAVDGIRVILSGAGSSAFVGECAVNYLNKSLNGKVEAIATTDIVACPEDYLRREIPTLLVSFARSGNSPESVGTVELVNELVDEVYHLVVTCNSHGKLAKMFDDHGNSLVLTMPEECNDKGFAMTSSFSSMLLSLYMVFNIKDLEVNKSYVQEMVATGKFTLKKHIGVIKGLADRNFDRVVYLGASGLEALAKEAALKILELTRGKITTLYNTPLGFRHGPKSYLDGKTVAMVFMSNNEYTRQYEKDLLNELKGDDVAELIITFSGYQDSEITNYSDMDFAIEESQGTYTNDFFLIFNYLLYAQLFSFYKSIALGITPDNPNPMGHVNRVVKGVVIYPIQP